MKALYIHVPFCKSICSYCDFTRCIYKESLVNAWLERIVCDLKKVKPPVRTIYIGGGTPSCLSYAQLEMLLQAVNPYLKNVEEFTMEANVESLDKDKISLLKKSGVNRISLGVQSFQERLLKEMNRKHSKEMIIDTITNIYHTGIQNISIDLIYGFASQTLADWQNDLTEALSIPYVTHISLYSLTIEENSVFGKLGKTTCDNEVEGMMYETAIKRLEEAGFKQYEIANFARKGYEAKHNQMYWEYEDFYGIGIGASGKEGNMRYCINGRVQAYVDGKETIEQIPLTKADMMFENIMMSLRMRKGLDVSVFNKRYDVDFLKRYHDIVEKGIEEKEFVFHHPYLSVTRKGMFYLHDILIRFLDDE